MTLRLKSFFKKAVLAAPLSAPLAAQASTGLTLGPLFFTAPLALLGLAALPVLYRWMRQDPPKPIETPFPQVQLLAEIEDEEQQPERIHWLHIATRLGAAGAIIGALSGPQWMAESGPAMIVIDNGWSAAPSWDATREQAGILIDRAARTGAPVVILPLAAPEAGGTVEASPVMTPDDARTYMSAINPHPWPADYAAATHAVQAVAQGSTSYSVTWLTPGIAAQGYETFAETLLRTSSQVRMLQPETPLYHLALPVEEEDSLVMAVSRIGAAKAEQKTVLALAENNQVLGRADLVFDENATQATASFAFDPLVRNTVAQFVLEGGGHAAATVLMDEKWRRRPVGLIAATDNVTRPSPLEPAFYLQTALEGLADLQYASLDRLLERKQSVLVLSDDVPVSEADRLRLVAWVKGGGVLLRFAGPNLVDQAFEGDELLPVKLRKGGEAFAGEIGSDTGIRPPQDDVPSIAKQLPTNFRVRSMIHAVPGPQSDKGTWLRTDTGAPFITAKALGSGHSILIHTSADPDSSDLVLSGALPKLLRAMIDFARGGDSALVKPAAPYRVLDATGQMRNPGPAVQPLTAAIQKNAQFGPAHPPGLYGDSLTRTAFNLSAAVPEIRPFDTLPDRIQRSGYIQSDRDGRVAPYLYGAGAVLLILSMGLTLWRRRMIPGLKPGLE